MSNFARILMGRKHKYGARRTRVGNEWFDSQTEADHCAQLRRTYGPANVIRQVSIPIGEQRIRPDFLIIHERFEDGTFRAELVDSKGYATKDWRRKARDLERLHEIRVREVRKGNS